MRFVSQLPWFATAPALVGAAVLVAFGLNYFVGPYFERSFLDEPDPLAAVLAGPNAANKPAATGSTPVASTGTATNTAVPTPSGGGVASPTTPATTVPAATPTSGSPVAGPTTSSSPTQPSATQPPGSVPTTAAPTSTATSVPTAPAQAAVLAQGSFRDGDPAHNGKGSARIIRDAAGNLILRFENFSVTNGPDLRVFLTTTDGYGGERIDLGKLKATDGNQNYPIPPGTDVSKYRSVVIWCVAFPTLFAIATLGAP